MSFAAKNIEARKLVALLHELLVEKGKPAYFCCDNSPEFIRLMIEKFAEENRIEIQFSQPEKLTKIYL